MGKVLHPWVIALCVLFLSACGSVRDISGRVDVELLSLGKAQASSQEQAFVLELRLTNLGAQPLEFSGVVYDLELEGFRLIRGVQGNIPRLEPYTSIDISVQASISLLNSVRFFNEIATGNKQQLQYVLRTRLDRASFWDPVWRLEQKGVINLAP